MTNRSKNRGTLAETAVASHLALWFPSCERRTLSGVNDRGDIAGIPNTVLEVKNCGTYDIPGWLREAQAERLNAKVDHCAVVVKPRGVGTTRVGDWWVVTTLDNYACTLQEAAWWEAQAQ